MPLSRSRAFSFWLAIVGILVSITVTDAAPAAIPIPIVADSTLKITAIAQSQIDSYKSSSYYASAAYCNPNVTRTWTCGTSCKANVDFTPIASGGDGGLEPFWYVGYDCSLDAIVVSHQGTDPAAISPVLTDLNLLQDKMDPELFPGLDPDMEAHAGFLYAHSLSAADVLDAVQKSIQTYETTNILLTGHSLGAALSLLDAVYLPIHLQVPNTTHLNLTYVGFGLPRVGDQLFADHVDSLAPDTLTVTHINNREDPVPIIPGRGLGYHHPAGEIHIDADTGEWFACPGQDNPDKRCAVGAVRNVFLGDTDDHTGPYNGVMMGSGCDA